jgi:predicted DNA-binding transcriptional regulator YafY
MPKTPPRKKVPSSGNGKKTVKPGGSKSPKPAAKKAVKKEKKTSKTPKKGKKKISNNTSRDHLFRLFTIFSEIQNGRRTKRSELAKFCDVSTRTIARDILTLSLLLDDGVTTKNVKKAAGDEARGGDKEYTLDPSQRHFPIVRIDEKTLLLVHFLRECLEPYKSTGIGKNMLESFKRSFGVLTGTTNWKQNWSRVLHFRFEGRPEAAKDDVKYFEIFHKAILGNRKVSFVYRSTNAPKKGPLPNSSEKKEDRVRILHPNFVFMRNNALYLHAVDPGENKEKIFKFSRIRSLKIQEEKFKPLPRFPDPSEYFKYSFAIIPCSEPPKENVVLEFSGKSVRRVEETIWHAEQKLTKLSEDRVRLELPFPEATFLELKPWLLSWGASVKVIGPQKLKDDVAKDIRVMADKI